MASMKLSGYRIAAICSCVPSKRFDNLRDTTEFSPEEVRKVTGMAGISARRLADDSMCSSDLCEAAANRALDMSGWERESVDALIMVTQTPDYFMPSTSCVLHKKLGLSDRCAAFDVGQGCSGYPYGLSLAGMMLQTGGAKRVLLLHGDTPARYTDKGDRAVSLLFGDAGSATALEACEENANDRWFFVLQTDGSGYQDLIIKAGGLRDRFNADRRNHCVTMNGANVFNFTIKRVPDLVKETLALAGRTQDEIDYFIFHQANHFIIKHLAKKLGVPDQKIPLIMKEYGNTGGVSLPLTITLGAMERPADKPLRLLLLGYGAGLSWGSALFDLGPEAKLDNIELTSRRAESHAKGSVG